MRLKGAEGVGERGEICPRRGIDLSLEQEGEVSVNVGRRRNGDWRIGKGHSWIEEREGQISEEWLKKLPAGFE
jgi:hypothetical protein